MPPPREQISELRIRGNLAPWVPGPHRGRPAGEGGTGHRSRPLRDLTRGPWPQRHRGTASSPAFRTRLTRPWFPGRRAAEPPCEWAGRADQGEGSAGSRARRRTGPRPDAEDAGQPGGCRHPAGRPARRSDGRPPVM